MRPDGLAQKGLETYGATNPETRLKDLHGLASQFGWVASLEETAATGKGTILQRPGHQRMPRFAFRRIKFRNLVCYLGVVRQRFITVSETLRNI